MGKEKTSNIRLASTQIKIVFTKKSQLAHVLRRPCKNFAFPSN